ncbi:MAG: tetratricopeptide repeat protein [Candidatus Acidiferrum sp.]
MAIRNSKKSNDAGAFASLGVVLSSEQKYPEAVTAYRKALTLDPHLPGVQLNWGLAEFKQGHFEAAIPPLKAAMAADSHGMQVSALLGLSYFGAKRFPDAVKYLQRAVTLDPNNKELHQSLAQSCLLAKNFQCALEEFRMLGEMDPDSSSVHVLTGEALDGQGKTAEAIVEFQKAVDLSPANLIFILHSAICIGNRNALTRPWPPSKRSWKSFQKMLKPSSTLVMLP